jgi:hypothetical protein
MYIVHWLFSVCVTFNFNDGFFVEWDDDREGLVRMIAREKEWEKRQAFNDAVDWGKKDGSEASPEEGWPGVPADAVWPSYDAGDPTRTHGWPSVERGVEVVVEVCSDASECQREHSACRCL